MNNRQLKALLEPIRRSQYDFDAARVLQALNERFSTQPTMHMCAPFGDFDNTEQWFDTVYRPLFAAIPDLERRDYIVIAGQSDTGHDWVGCAGYFTGVFANAWLDIPPTGHQVHMRFHEFYRLEDSKIVETQIIWDIPELMIQAGAWPMAPSLGREWLTPAPATQDGLTLWDDNPAAAKASAEIVIDMLNHLTRHPAQGGPEVMEMERFWHPRMSWYGPAGIGTGRGIQGFRDWHQIPFLNAMPDRGQSSEPIDCHFFAEQHYVAVTGWPNMRQTLSHSGWLGLVPNGQKISLRSLDFWRIENQLIRENWVLVDLLDLYQQLGVDVFDRLREFNKARQGFCKTTGKAL